MSFRTLIGRGLVGLDVAVMLTFVWSPVFADWDRGGPHKMHYPQLPDISPTGMDVVANWPLPYESPSGAEWGKILADDWRCRGSGPVTDIHIWGSWLYDELPMDPSGEFENPKNVRFKLSIHKDIPALVDQEMPWSHPGPQIWSDIFEPGDQRVVPRLYAEIPQQEEPELFYDPNLDEIVGYDRQVWQYNFFLDSAIGELFSQEEGSIYWLDVQAWPHPDDESQAAIFGWKTSLDHFNDDAVFGDNFQFGDEPVPIPDGHPMWVDMHYPEGHEFEFQGIDLAFVINGSPTILYWQGGPGRWNDPVIGHWTITPGNIENLPPAANTDMVIDEAGSLVAVVADFTWLSGTGPAASVSVGANNFAKLTVASGITLEVTGETGAGMSGRIAVKNGAMLQTGSAVINMNGRLIAGVQGSLGDSGLLDSAGQMTIVEADAIQMEWLPLPPDPVTPTVAAASMFGGLYTVAQYTGVPLATAGKTTNLDANIGAGYIKSVDYTVALGGSVLGVQVTLQPQGLGDTDLDADVDGDDLATFGLAWSPSGTDKTWFDGDFDFDGDIDGDDLAALGLAWAPGGITFPAGDIQVTTVPEPGTIIMLLIGLIGLALFGRRHR